MNLNDFSYYSQIIGDKEASTNVNRNALDQSPNEKSFEQKIIPMSKPFKGHSIQSVPDFVKTLKLYPVTRTKFECDE